MNFQKALKYFVDQGLEGLKGMNIGLVGEVGAGKSWFISKLIKALDLDQREFGLSPTFILEMIYQIKGFEIRHYDLYRIEDEDELYDLDIFEALEDSSICTLIEWPDHFSIVVNQLDLVLKITNHKNQRLYELIKPN